MPHYSTATPQHQSSNYQPTHSHPHINSRYTPQTFHHHHTPHTHHQYTTSHTGTPTGPITYTHPTPHHWGSHMILTQHYRQSTTRHPLHTSHPTCPTHQSMTSTSDQTWHHTSSQLQKDGDHKQASSSTPRPSSRQLEPPHTSSTSSQKVTSHNGQHYQSPSTFTTTPPYTRTPT